MNYVIIDLEFNNLGEITEFYPKFYEENAEVLEYKCPNEIIEIGAIKLDRTMKEIDRFKTYIKPSIYKILNPKIIEITGIHEENLKDGIHFKEALKKLGKFIGENSIVCSWAKDDIAELIRNADYHNYGSIPWLKEYIDLQEYCTRVLAEKRSISLKNALNKLKIKMVEKDLHDALNDAVYTAEVFKRIYNDKAVKNFIVKDIINMPSIMIKDLKNFKLDEKQTELKCPKCGEKIELEYPLKLFKWRFIGLGFCDKCRSKVIQKIVVKQTLAGDKVYIGNNKILNDREYLELTDRFVNNKLID
ncbi:Exonuclease [Clostridium sp. USBA 49]|uniref:3'-5' exonuclease n=1 Tax=Clostridium TaxID=1485 RepID=UPI00099A1C1B|nr:MULTISPECIES: 3'-5' exonuclease [Clostridium]SKA73259.1 Exonuclease [Clostridium sp. USBA 49]